MKSKSRIRWAVFSIYFCQGLVFSSWASRIPDFRNYFRMNDGQLGTTLMMIPIGQLCAMYFSGLLVSRFGSKRIFPIAIFGYGFCLILLGLSPSLLTLRISLFLFGVFSNLCNISINTQGINAENMYKKPIMSSFHGGWSIANFTGSLLGLLMINLNMKPLFHYFVALIFLIIIILSNKKYLLSDTRHVSIQSEEKKKNRPEFFLYLFGIVCFCGMACEGAMFDWSGVYFQDVVKVEKGLVPLGFTVFMIMMACGRFIADKVIEKFGRRFVIQTGGLLISVGLILAVLFPNVWIVSAAFMIVGLGTSSIVPTIYSLVGKKTKISTGTALALVSSISFFGFLIGPPMIGYISQLTSLRIAYLIIACFGFTIFIMASLMKIFKDDTL